MTFDHILVLLFFLYLIRESFQKFNSIQSVNTYAIGNKTFSTFALASTITATWISGSGFVLDLTQFYKEGMVYFIASLGMCLNLAIIAYFLTPRMQGFLGKTSVASIMGSNYGTVIQNITAISGCIYSCGSITVQFKIMGNLIHYLTDWNTTIATMIGGSVIIFYTYSGGIRSVVKTDVIQAICFSLALIVAISAFDMKYISSNSIQTADLSKFSLRSLLYLTQNEYIDLILLTGYFLVPGLSPSVVQRISMAKDLQQARSSYFYSSIALVVVLTFSCWIAYLVFLIDPSMIDNDKKILPFLINSYTISGAKAFLIIGLISMCMSTADSSLNISSVLLANDIFLFRKFSPIEKMNIARCFTLVIGIGAIYFATTDKPLLSILLIKSSFYLPIVSIPLLGIVFGLKTTTRCCLLTMFICGSFVLIFKLIIPLGIDLNFLGMILNSIVLVSSHYIIEKWELLKCVGIKSKL